MRVAFIPWIALSVIVLGSGEVALPSDSVETLTRDICLAPNSRAHSLESLSGAARATVAGVLRFKREVELLVSVSATIGPVEGATPVMLAPAQPPPQTIE